MRSIKSRGVTLLRNFLFFAVAAGIVLASTVTASGARGLPAGAAPAFRNSANAPTSFVYLPAMEKSSSATDYLYNPSGVYLGVYQPGMPQNLTVFTAFEDMVGKRIAFAHWYEGWNLSDDLDVAAAQAVADHGSIPLITWEPWDTNANIIAGKWDAYVTRNAQSVKDYGQPVFLRFAHEMNGGYPWAVGKNGNTTQSFIAMWRHVHDIFTSVGASNVIWVWAPNVGGSIPLADMYPGDSYVDWMGIDGWNGGTVLDWGGWLSFSDVFWGPYHELIQIGAKPIMVSETGCVEQGGSKAAWITDAMLTQLPQNFPRIHALVWFNADWFDDTGKEADWRVETSPSSLASYSQAAADPYFKSAP